MMTKEGYIDAHKRLSKNTIAIDFDGVIHRSSKGYHDGTIYDELIEGADESIKALKSKGCHIIVYTCKANPNRPKIDGKGGVELVWEWLKNKGLEEYVDDVVWGKPWAKVYIDDNGYRFTNWKDTMNFIEELGE